MEENRIEQLVKRIAETQLGVGSEEWGVKSPNSANNTSKLTLSDYPLAQKRPELIKSYTGKTLNDITLEKVVDEEVKPEDIRISAEVLELQAQVAEANGKKQFAHNLRRAAELTRIPDEKVLEIYELLRPRRATKQQLLDAAQELETKYQAKITAKLIREAAEVYETRKILR
jgi:propanediol dehydratase small subunit